MRRTCIICDTPLDYRYFLIVCKRDGEYHYFSNGRTFCRHCVDGAVGALRNKGGTHFDFVHAVEVSAS